MSEPIRVAKIMEGFWEIQLNAYPRDDESGDVQLFATAKCSHCGMPYRENATVDSQYVEIPEGLEGCDQREIIWKVARQMLDRIYTRQFPPYCERCGGFMGRDLPGTWIPVSDHNPRTSGRFMVTVKNKGKPHVEMANYDKASDTWKYYSDSCNSCSDGIIAWQMRPLAYKGKEAIES